MRRNETPEGKSVRLLRVGEQVRHAISDVLMRGDVHITNSNVASNSGPIRAGQIRAYAVTSTQRIPELPDVQTLTEAGFAGIGSMNWNGLFVPVQTPQPMACCHIVEGDRTIPAERWLSEHNLQPERCGLSALAHVRDAQRDERTNDEERPVRRWPEDAGNDHERGNDDRKPNELAAHGVGGRGKRLRQARK